MMMKIPLPKSAICFTAGLVLGGCGWWFGDGPLTMASARIADERYEQRPSCRPARVSLHRVLHLRFTAPRDTLRKTHALLINDPLRDAPLTLVLDAPKGADQAGFVRYEHLFGKDVHRETWRPFCSGQRCAPSLNYHPPELDQAQLPRDITMLMLDNQGQVLQTILIKTVPTTMSPGHEIVSYMPKLYLGNTASDTDKPTPDFVVVSPTSGRSVTGSLQTGWAGNRHEAEADIDLRHGQEMIMIQPDNEYNAFYATSQDWWHQHLYENKIEWHNIHDPFMDCRAAGIVHSNDAAPATPPRPMTTPDALPPPAGQK